MTENSDFLEALKKEIKERLLKEKELILKRDIANVLRENLSVIFFVVLYSIIDDFRRSEDETEKKKGEYLRTFVDKVYEVANLVFYQIIEELSSKDEAFVEIRKRIELKTNYMLQILD